MSLSTQSETSTEDAEYQQRYQTIVENLASIRERMKAVAGGEKARLVAVSKKKPASDVLIAYKAGHRHFGENYVQELVEKSKELPSDIKWHFIGSLQSNKCKTLASIPNLWIIETIDSIKKANGLNKSCESRDTPLKVFIQVNTSKEENKSGVEIEKCVPLAEHIIDNCNNLELCGLMTIGAADWEPSHGPNPYFRILAQCRDEVKEQVKQKNGIEIDLKLSMGMSDDLQEALEAGSTEIRIGTAIFGARLSNKLAM
ncbi:699_t:CDS:2 [Paraglomus brasilianum]|uniref:Pyridoxal phosphate homeostasis protein n=1 Tax=Paraglomus brasilianum TaxID=144538 RepID=A0A9N9ABX5_9GLOM|nr:699_t:CDS:2 [Paraglomus brasilianum]